MGLAVSAANAWAAITVEEARVIAQAHTATSLDNAEVWVRDIGGGLQIATFRVNDGDECVESVRVDMTHGVFDCVSRPRPEGTPTLTAEQCLAYAQAEAEAQMGDDAQNLTWTAELLVDEEVLCAGKGPLVGTPPRSGLTPSCEVNVSTVDGTILDFSDSIPEGEEPMTPTVSAEEAEQIALQAVDIEGATVVGSPELVQERGQLSWFVNVRPPWGEPDWIVQVSATTGGVISVAEPQSAPSAEAKPPSQAVTAAQTPRAPTRATLPTGVADTPGSGSERGGIPLVPVIALVLLLCAAGGLVLLRRRR